MSATQTAILCKKCKEVLNNEDDIFGTSCGHLYHFLCLRECHGRSTNCTDCNAYKPSMFKMFLDFGKTPMSLEDQMRILQLHNILEESQNTIASLEEKEKMSKLNLQKLECKMKKMYDTLKTRDSTILDMEDRIESLEQLNKFLSNENGQKSKTNNVHDTSEITLNFFKTKWEEELKKALTLSVENMKLKSMLLAATDNPDDLINFSQDFNEDQGRNDISSDNEQSGDISTNTDVKKSNENISKESEQYGNDNSRKIVIRNYTRKTIKYPLEKNIEELALKLGLSLTTADIEDIQRININSNKINLIVLFRNEKLKEDFFEKKHILKTFKSFMKCLKIEELMDVD